jgi:hypothetical protein
VFNVGAFTATADLAGVLFQNAPTFNVGDVTSSVDLSGVLFENVPSFFGGTVVLTVQYVDGLLFSNTPVFFVAQISGGVKPRIRVATSGVTRKTGQSSTGRTDLALTAARKNGSVE